MSMSIIANDSADRTGVNSCESPSRGYLPFVPLLSDLVVPVSPAPTPLHSSRLLDYTRAVGVHEFTYVPYRFFSTVYMVLDSFFELYLSYFQFCCASFFRALILLWFSINREWNLVSTLIVDWYLFRLRTQPAKPARNKICIINLQVFTYQKQMSLGDFVRYLFWHSFLITLGIICFPCWHPFSIKLHAFVAIIFCYWFPG